MLERPADAAEDVEEEVCSRRKCPYKAKALGLCQKHYNAHRRVHPPVETARVAAHIDQLAAQGLSHRSIAAVAGVGVKTINDAHNLKSKYLLARTANRILAVDPQSADVIERNPYDKAMVSVLGTARRLQALVALGYTNQDLVAEMGEGAPAKPETLLHPAHPFVFVATARRVSELYDRLKDTTPPDSFGGRRAKLRAQRQGWVVPNMWDDIDDPNEVPAVGGHVTAAERIAELLDMGVSGVNDIAQRLQIKPESVKRELTRINARERRAEEWNLAWDEAHAEQRRREAANWIPPRELAEAS